MDPSRLSTIPLLDGLPEEEVRRVAIFAEEHTVANGHTLVREGDWSDRLAFIEDGAVEVRRDGETVATLGVGDVFGEAGVLGRTLRNASVVAVAPLRLITLNGWDLKRLPELGRRLAERSALRV